MTKESSAPQLLATAISTARTGDYATVEDVRARLEALATEAARKPASPFSRSEPIAIPELEVAALIELGQGRTELAAEQYGKLAQIWEERKTLPELDEALDYLAGEGS